MKAIEAARIVCRTSEWECGIARLIALLYIAHMTFMGARSRALIEDEPFTATDNGPTLKKLARTLSALSAGGPVKQAAFQDVPLEGQAAAETEYLDLVTLKFRKVPDEEVTGVLLGPASAWRTALKAGRNSVIDEASIRVEYAIWLTRKTERDLLRKIDHEERRAENSKHHHPSNQKDGPVRSYR